MDNIKMSNTPNIYEAKLDYGDIILFWQNKTKKFDLLKFFEIMISNVQDGACIPQEYVHAELCVKPSYLGFVGALWPTVKYREMLAPETTAQRIDVFEVIGATQEEKIKACKYVIKKINTPYNLMEVLSFGNLKDKKSRYCTQLVSEAYKVLNDKFSKDKLISPNELYLSGLIKYKGTIEGQYWNTAFTV